MSLTAQIPLSLIFLVRGGFVSDLVIALIILVEEDGKGFCFTETSAVFLLFLVLIGEKYGDSEDLTIL